MASKLARTRKAGLFGGALVDFWAYMAFMLVLILFYAFFKITGDSIKENKAKVYFDDLKAESALVSYLRTPVAYATESGEINSNFAGLIADYYSAQGTPKESGLAEQLKAKTKEIFAKDYPSLKWTLKVSDKASKSNDFGKIALQDRNQEQSGDDEVIVGGLGNACSIMPVPNSKNVIKVELNLQNLNAKDVMGLEYGQFLC